MAKLSLVLSLSSIFLIINIISLLAPSARSQQTITIRAYLHDEFNASQPIEYGDVFAFQDPLTTGPSPNSTFLGRAQGTIAFTTHNSLTDIHVSIAYIFIGGEYDGSTVVAVGRNDVSQSTRQFPIVGGTGAFRLARGIVTGSTYSETPPVFIYDLEIALDNAISSPSSRIGAQ